jgi:anti-anti-sigma regulatory factor
LIINLAKWRENEFMNELLLLDVAQVTSMSTILLLLLVSKIDPIRLANGGCRVV